jgi:thiol-disulfide isomerase/thioredoxin
MDLFKKYSFLGAILDMDGVKNSVMMEDIMRSFDGLHDGSKKVLVVLVHKPKCPYCRKYYSEFNELCDRIPGLCGGKGDAMAIDFDDADESMRDETEFVPRVIFSTSNGDGTVTKRDLDEKSRNVDTILEMIREIMDSQTTTSRSLDEDTTPVITLTPMETPKKKETTKKKGKGRGKGKGKGRGKGKGKGKEKGKEQTGKGFIESALAATILGGTANAVRKSPLTKNYLKQAEKGLIGLSKASTDLASGTVKVISEQDMMKKLASVTKSLSKKSKRSRPRKDKRTKKNRRKGQKKGTRRSSRRR